MGATLTNSWRFHLLPAVCFLLYQPWLTVSREWAGSLTDLLSGGGYCSLRPLWVADSHEAGGWGGVVRWQDTWANILVYLCWRPQLYHTSACSNLPPLITNSWEGLSVWCWQGSGVITPQQDILAWQEWSWECSLIHCGFSLFVLILWNCAMEMLIA